MRPNKLKMRANKLKPSPHKMEVLLPKDLLSQGSCISPGLDGFAIPLKDQEAWG